MDYFEDEEQFYEKALQEIEHVKSTTACFRQFREKMSSIFLPFLGLILPVCRMREVIRTPTVVRKFHLEK